MVTTPVVGERKTPGLLFGGGMSDPAAPVVEVDPALPRGARRGWDERPAPQRTHCVSRRPICVHAAAAQIGEGALEAFAEALQRAYDDLVLTRQLPAPLADGVLGGGPEVDAYLVDAGEFAPSSGSGHREGDVALRVLTDPPRLRTDQSSGACLVARDLATDSTAARCLGHLMALRLDAAETPALREGYAEYLSWLNAGADAQGLAIIDDAQANPQLNVTARERDSLTRAAALWWSYLDSSLAAGAAGVLPTAVLSLSRATTSDAHPEWHNEPDAFDVLRGAFSNDMQRVADYLAGYAAGRLFLGNRNDGVHLPGLGWLGPLGRVRFDWVIDYSSLPRHLASTRALEPMGMSYVWLNLDSVPLGARLAFRIEWEEPVRFKWLVVSLDREGREMNRWDLPYLEKGQTIEKVLVNFEAAAALVFVGINLGGVSPSHPFDPDHEPWEPHAYTLYVTELPTQ